MQAIQLVHINDSKASAAADDDDDDDYQNHCKLTFSCQLPTPTAEVQAIYEISSGRQRH